MPTYRYTSQEANHIDPPDPKPSKVFFLSCPCLKCQRSEAPAGRIIDSKLSFVLATAFSKNTAFRQAVGLWKVGLISRTDYAEIVTCIQLSDLAEFLLEKDEKERLEFLKDYCSGLDQ